MTEKQNSTFVNLIRKAVGLPTGKSACCGAPATEKQSSCCNSDPASQRQPESCCK